MASIKLYFYQKGGKIFGNIRKKEYNDELVSSKSSMIRGFFQDSPFFKKILKNDILIPKSLPFQ